MSSASVISWVERGVVPDSVVRAGIRQMVRARLLELKVDNVEICAESKRRFVESMDHAAIAPAPHLANQQHYEIPAGFFAEVLGKRRKYSCCLWPLGAADLEAAEQAALEETCARASISDGQRILELGCGWGSLTLWMAEKYPNARIEAVSNSSSQKLFIDSEARRLDLNNIVVHTADMNDFTVGGRFDRVISIEMFEHMRNYRQLFARVHDWLTSDGLFFLHIFCHRSEVYEFLDNGPSDWMSRYFFTGGIMPSNDLPLHFQEHLVLESQWRWSGTHYEKTANAWLERLDERRDHIMPILHDAYGDDASIWHSRWRVFFMACAELFGYRDGNEWYVGHYLFKRRQA